ncbi:MAG: IS630 family transposase, partial [bacterium]|nr:IS630 family transposase [bacterium]
RELQDSINTWIDHWNQNPKPFTWHRTADDILATLATYLTRINGSGH